MPMITLLTGGARSGKSSYALKMAEAYKRKAFIATAEPFDDEMKERIRRHKEERNGACLTIEEPLELAKAIRGLPHDIEVAVVDCLTVWLGNLMHYRGEEFEGCSQLRDLYAVLADPPCDMIIVSNELGMGLIPEAKMSRRYRDEIGYLNQAVARLARKVIFMVSGLPLLLK